MKYLHTMVRVRDLDAALDFYCAKLGLEEISRTDNPAGKFTLVFLAAPGDADTAKDKRTPTVELTYQLRHRGLSGRSQLRPPRPMRWMTSTPPVSASRTAGSRSIGRRATGAWLSCALPTASPSSCCRRGRRSLRRSRGCRCRTLGCGERRSEPTDGRRRYRRGPAPGARHGSRPAHRGSRSDRQRSPA